MWFMHEGFGWWMALGGLWMFLFWEVLLLLLFGAS